MIHLIISHQVFWSLLSFSIFYFLMDFLVIQKIKEVEKKRKDHERELEKKTLLLCDKIKSLDTSIYKIMHEEIPAKERSFIAMELEEITNELEDNYFNLSEILEKEFQNKKNKFLQSMIISTKSAKVDVQELSQDLIKRVNYE